MSSVLTEFDQTFAMKSNFRSRVSSDLQTTGHPEPNAESLGASSVVPDCESHLGSGAIPGAPGESPSQKFPCSLETHAIPGGTVTTIAPPVSQLLPSQEGKYAPHCQQIGSRPKKSTRTGSVKRKSRPNLPKEVKNKLSKWLTDNFHNPYPTDQEKASLAKECGISTEQVGNWFINARGREWRPKLRAMMKAEQEGKGQPLLAILADIKSSPYHILSTKDRTKAMNTASQRKK